MFRFEGPLLYLSFDYFKRTLIEKTRLDPSGRVKFAAGERRAHKLAPPCNSLNDGHKPLKNEDFKVKDLQINGDCTGITGVVTSLENIQIHSQGTIALEERHSTREVVLDTQSLSHIGEIKTAQRSIENETSPKRSSTSTYSQATQTEPLPMSVQTSNRSATSESSSGGLLNPAFIEDPECESKKCPGLREPKPSTSTSSGTGIGSSSPAETGSSQPAACPTIDIGSIGRNEEEEVDARHRQLVLDCSSWSGIDYSALEQLVEVNCST